jgi:hypothetical protein
MAFREFQPGCKVRLTGKFLRATGQQCSFDARKTWTIRALDGHFAVVDEPADTSWFSAKELAADPSLRFRRIHIDNLYIVGQADSRNAT